MSNLAAHGMTEYSIYSVGRVFAWPLWSLLTSSAVIQVSAFSSDI